MVSVTQRILDNTIKGLSEKFKYDTIWLLISELQKHNKMSFRDLNILIKNNVNNKT